ncbi:Ceramide glucosyltransferase [Sphingomonas paucimobilis]|nr:Ceramide glucosyltransferase [Sphingomonas paucimobilis]
MNEEVELKLELPRDAVEAFERSALIPGEGDRAELNAIYFDTPGSALRALGYSLRIRRSGGKRIQTVKADHGESGGGLFARGEWEMPVKDDQPVIDTRTPLPSALGDAAGLIAPAFHVDVERRTWMVEEQGARAEMVLDKGVVRAGDREAPVCEIELELKEGEASALFALARRIEAAAPVRLGIEAKSERGYRLLGAAPASFKAEPVTLKPGSSPQEAFRTIARACLRHYRLNENLLLDHYDPQALHQARVAVRRLRSALTLFKPILPDQNAVRFQDELRWLARELGEARDLDVLIDSIAPGPLHDRIEAARQQAHADILKMLESRRVRSLMIDFAEWLTLNAAPSGGGESAKAFAAERLRHFYRWVVKHGRDMAELDDEHRHAVRKKAKKLRYASEFFASLFSEGKKDRKRHADFIKALEALQDRLGALNDMASMAGLLAKHGVDAGEQAVEPAGKDKKKLIKAAAKAHDKLADARPFWS